MGSEMCIRDSKHCGKLGQKGLSLCKKAVGKRYKGNCLSRRTLRTGHKLSCKTDTSLPFSQPCTGMFSFRRKSDISWGRSNFSCPFISSVQLSSGNRQSGRSRQAHAYRSSGKACRKPFIDTDSGNKRIRCGDIDVAMLFCNICFINFGLLKSRRS